MPATSCEVCVLKRYSLVERSSGQDLSKLHGLSASQFLMCKGDSSLGSGRWENLESSLRGRRLRLCVSGLCPRKLTNLITVVHLRGQQEVPLCGGYMGPRMRHVLKR